MPPRFSYRIWKTQRSGSTLLYKALCDTGIAGIPGEHFYLLFEDSFDTANGLDLYGHFKQTLWQRGMTPNGVMGINHDFSRKHYAPYFKRLLAIRGLSPEHPDGEAFWEDIFPNVKHIYLTRRNKIRQAVSWWRAIQDNVWHLTQDQRHANPADFYAEKYDEAALRHLLRELMLKECNAQAYFQANGIVPLTVVYEDMVADFTGTLLKVLSYLGLYKKGMSLPSMHYRPTADEQSEIWINRLRADLQGDKLEEWVW